MRIRLGDILLAAVIAAAAVILMFGMRSSADDTLAAVISRDGQEIARVDLGNVQEDWVYEIEELGIVIEAEGGRIRFAASSCLDQTCVHTGWLTRAGDTAVCLPNGVIVKIVGQPSSDIDVIAE